MAIQHRRLEAEIEETSEVDAETTGEFHAWVEHPEHIFDPNLMRVSIRLFPDANTFPGLGSADVNRLDDMVVQATVRVDVSVPLWNAQIANRPQSHIQRERARGREALEFCRRAILNASGLLVVAPRYEDSDRLVHCRVVLLDEAGDRVDLGELLVKNGFAAVRGRGLGAEGASVSLNRGLTRRTRRTRILGSTPSRFVG